MNQTPTLYCAFDTVDLAQARDWSRALAGHIDGVKLGLEFFCAHGPDGVKAVRESGLPVFLDLKLHDIPNTVAGAMRAVAGLGIRVITVHAAGGAAMMRAAAETAAETAEKAGLPGPQVVGVTVMTSLAGEDLAATGQQGPVGDQVLRLARLAMDSGLHGVVSAASEAALLRQALGQKALLVTPGIRPVGSSAGDQKRVVTPADAVRSGSSLLVVGRPITGAADPVAAAAACRAEMLAAFSAA